MLFRPKVAIGAQRLRGAQGLRELLVRAVRVKQRLPKSNAGNAIAIEKCRSELCQRYGRPVEGS